MHVTFVKHNVKGYCVLQGAYQNLSDVTVFLICLLFHCKPLVHAASLCLFLTSLLISLTTTTTPNLCSSSPTPSAQCILLFQLLVIMQVPDWLTSPAAG